MTTTTNLLSVCEMFFLLFSGVVFIPSKQRPSVNFCFVFVDTEGKSKAVMPVPACAVITALEQCQRHLGSVRHEDLDSPVRFLLYSSV